MKLGVEVKNAVQSLKLQFEVSALIYHQPTYPTTLAKTTPNNNFGLIWMKFGIAFKSKAQLQPATPACYSSLILQPATPAHYSSPLLQPATPARYRGERVKIPSRTPILFRFL